MGNSLQSSLRLHNGYPYVIAQTPANHCLDVWMLSLLTLLTAEIFVKCLTLRSPSIWKLHQLKKLKSVCCQSHSGWCGWCSLWYEEVTENVPASYSVFSSYTHVFCSYAQWCVSSSLFYSKKRVTCLTHGGNWTSSSIEVVCFLCMG